MPEPNETPAPTTSADVTPHDATAPCDCPPPTERAPTPASDPRGELLQMAAALVRSRDARLLAEYLRMRRAASMRVL